ncbi:MAG TPA: histidine kinase [Herpetosiphonaceae bacterium]
MHSPLSHRTLLFAPFIVIVFSLLGIGWSVRALISSPYTGADWSQSTGAVIAVDVDGPANGLIQVGDRIIAIDGIPLHAASSHATKAVGDTIQFQISRSGIISDAQVRLQAAPLLVTLRRLMPVIVAITFWLVSVVVLALKPTGTQSWLFLLFCQVFVGALVFGAVNFTGRPWTVRLFQSLLWWVGPITIHFHLYFPLSLQSRYTRLSILACYLIAALGSGLPLVGSSLQEGGLPSGFFSGSLIWMTACLLSVVFLLWQAYRGATTLEIQRQLRLVALGGGVAFISFLILLLVPYALIHQPLLPYDIAFLLLMIIPITYGYAILSYRLIQLDSYVSRIAAYMLVLSTLISMYLVLNIALTKVIPATGQQQATANLVTIVALTSTSIPLYRRLQTIANYVFYGGSYDYRSAVQLVSRTLDQPRNPEVLPQILCSSIQKAMQLECVRLLLLNATGMFTQAGLSCQQCVGEQDQVYLKTTSQIAQYLRDHPYPVYTSEMHTHLNDQALSAHEIRLLGYEHTWLWIPLFAGSRLLGLYIMGPKRGSEVFDVTDLEIVQVIMRLSSVTMQNIQFIDELQQQAAEKEKLHQQVINAREEERKRVARELHDQIIQSLASMNYQLTNLRSQLSPDQGDQVVEVQSNLQQTLVDVRRICADLRPPALDNLGLVSAVRSRLRALQQQSSIEAFLHVSGDPHQPIPEDVALTLFRVMQEALNNVLKHAEAQTVEVQIYIQPDEICLVVRDDGKGFHVPQRLGQLIEDHHFGLVGLRERLEMIRGTLYVSSLTGEGACIRATVPLTPLANSPHEGIVRP